MIEWQWCSFGELANTELYEMLALRQNVFILEQQCFYNDFDGYDQAAHHLLGWRTVDGKRELAACLRCLAPESATPSAKLRPASWRSFQSVVQTLARNDSIAASSPATSFR